MRKLLTCIFGLMILSPPAQAACSGPTGTNGEIIYNSDHAVFQGCTSEGWKTMTGLGGGGVPAGAVMAFALTTCPVGWSEYVEARGRFLRGIDNGAGNDPGGTRAPGTVQADAFQGHYHSGAWSTVNIVSYSTGGGYNGTQGNSPNGTPQANTPVADGSNGTPRTAIETRPKNVAVLFCVKN